MGKNVVSLCGEHTYRTQFEIYFLKIYSFNSTS